MRFALAAAFSAYCVLPLLLYAYTPMGTAVRLFLGLDDVLSAQVAQEPVSYTAGLFRASSQPEPANVFQPTVSPPLMAPRPAAVATQKAEDPPPATIAVLLLGYGGVGHDGAYLTDSMVLAVVNPGDKTLTLVSLPRDIWVQLPVGTRDPYWNKLNTAYVFGVDNTVFTAKPARYKGQHGGGNLSKDVASSLLGVPIQYYVALNFEGFRKMIDAVGGIDVLVQSPFSANYPRNDNPDIDSTWTVVRFAAGRQRMNGERAIQFARAREVFDNPAESNDFARSRRQRLIMEAFKDRVFSLEALPRLPGLLNVSREYVSTDLAMPGLGDVQSLLTDWRGLRVSSVTLSPQNYLREGTGPAGTYILSPASGDWTQLHSFMRKLIRNPAFGEQLATTQLHVQNASGRTVELRALEERLTAAGYRFGTTVTVPLQATTSLEDRADGAADLLVADLTRQLEGDGRRIRVTDGTRSPLGPTIVLTVGQDIADGPKG